MELASKISFFVTLIAWSHAANETGLTTLTDYDCGCPGQNASYTCTAVGGVITVWGGTAFNCGDRDEISLRHNQFQSAVGECNDGAIVGYGIENVDNCYTSRLDVRLSADLQGQTITCSVDDGGGVTALGTRTLTVTTPSVAPPPRPQGITTLIANNNPRELIFRWDRVDSANYNCSTLQYDFTSENCGSCTVVTPRVVSCTGFQTSSAGITCTFTVWSIVCGNITSQDSMESVDVSLKVPDAPIVQSLPRYLDGRTKILIGLMTTFRTVGTSFIYSGIDGSVMNYTITYFDITFGSSCGTASIPASSCVGGTCTHNFDILRNSSCPPSTAIIVSVVASNVLGSSPPSTPLLREGLNNLVNVNFDPTRRSITCTFLNQPINILKQCNATITYGENCDRFLNTFSGVGTGDTVETQPLEVVPGVVEYCFLVIAESNNVIVLVDGTLQNLDSQTNDNVTAPIVVPLVLVLLILFALVILGPIAAVKYFSVDKSTVCITFSVEDKPGSLARALNVFKECKVNILGLNTHRYHVDVHRDAGKGYKFNYVHCVCTKEEKDFLKRELKAVFKGDDREHTVENDSEAVSVTAIIKVKDSPGALCKAISTIGDRNINIVGVNTLSKRERIPGYKDNHVKCRCSDKNLQRVRTKLKLVTGKDVNIKVLDEEHDYKERAIEYFVEDKTGALASTLQVVSDMDINISGVNLDHLPAHVVNDRTAKGGEFTINFIECSIERSEKETLFNRLKTEYGAVDVTSHEVSPDRLDEDPNYCIAKVTIHNEAGSLNRILEGFHDLKINIHGVNILDLAFEREKEIPYKHYHLEITATDDQEITLKARLLTQGLAIDIKPFDITKHQQADQANDVQSEEGDTCSTTERDVSPTTKAIQFLVRDEVGALANALNIFGKLGINITKINPAHLSREHQHELVECSCAENQRKSLIEKLKSCGAIKTEVLPDKEVQQGKLFYTDTNYCVVKFSVGPEAGSIAKVLNAFPDMGVKIHKVNPPHFKVHNQYVECCCTETEKKKLLTRLEKIDGVTHVTLEPENNVSVKPTQDPNYCIIKYSVGDRAGTIVRALKVFFDLNINIIGVNTLNLAFNRTTTLKYKHNHVVLVATDEQEEELKHQLLVAGLAIDVQPYKRIQRSDNSELLQPGNLGRNDIALTSV